jgi:hypothetical protein
MRLITFILSCAIALTSIAPAAFAQNHAFGQASISSNCPIYEGYPDCH